MKRPVRRLGGFGYGWVFAYIAACWALVAVTVAVLGPRSGGAVLEDLQETGLERSGLRAH